LAIASTIALSACTPGPPAPGAPTGVPASTAIAIASPTDPPPEPSVPFRIEDGEPWVVYQDGSPGLGISLIRPDGTGRHPLWFGESGAFKHPDWSPDGERIVAVREDDNSIWIIDADGRHPAKLRIDACAATCDYPAWSPDGRSIAFSLVESADGIGGPSAGSIMVMTVDGGHVRSLARRARPDSLDVPRWSPDGRHLIIGIDAFEPTEEFEVGSAVASLSVDDGDVLELTPRDRFAYHPDWSVDGHIVFSTETLGVRRGERPLEGRWDLWSMHPDGSHLAQITKVADGEHLAQPTWTPDGRRIIATLEAPGIRTAVFVDPVNGAIQRMVDLPMTFARLRPT
jgi:Tol biopolymer transport system component